MLRVSTKRSRDVRAAIEAEGLRVESLTITGGCHLRCLVSAPDGRTSVIWESATPSDGRSDLNFRARLRRFARGAPDAGLALRTAKETP